MPAAPSLQPDCTIARARASQAEPVMLNPMKDSTLNLTSPAPPANEPDAEVAAGEVPFAGDAELAELRRAIGDWREQHVAQAVARQPLRKSRFVTWSGMPVPDALTPADVELDYLADLGL